MQQVEHRKCDRAGQSVDGAVVHDDSPLCDFENKSGTGLPCRAVNLRENEEGTLMELI